MTYFCTVLLVGLTAALMTAPVRSAENREGGARGTPGAVVSNDDDTNPAALAKNFVMPPDSCRPWVYAFFLNGNLTRGGITAVLEAMKRAGIGGMTVMEVDQGSPKGAVGFMSDEWRALFMHLVAEANRLGLEVNMNNDAGWNGSGAPVKNEVKKNRSLRTLNATNLSSSPAPMMERPGSET